MTAPSQEHSEAKSAAPKSRWRRFFRFAAVGFLLLIALLVILYLFRGRLLAEPLADFASDAMSEQLEGRFELDRIEGNWFGSLELVGMRTKTPPEKGSLKKLDFDRIRIEYDIWALLGDSPADAVESLVVENLHLELDLTAPSEPATEPPPTLEEITELLPTRLPRVDVQGKIECITTDGPLVVGKLKISGADDALKIQLDELTHIKALQDGAPSSITLDLEKPAKNRLRLVTSDDLWGLSLEEAKASVVAENDVDAELRARFSAGVIKVTLSDSRFTATVDGLERASLPAWIEHRLTGIDGVPESARLTARAEGRIDQEPLQLAFEATGSAINWPRTKDGSFTLRGTMKGDEIGVSFFEAAVAGAEARASGIRVNTTLEFPLVGLDDLRVSIPDLERSANGLELLPTDTPWPPQPVAIDAQIQGELEKPIRIESLSLRSGESRIGLTGSVVLPAEKSVWEDVGLDLALEGVVPAIEKLLSPSLELEGTRGRIDLGGRVRGTLGKPLADLDLEVANLFVKDQAAGRGNLKVDLRWPELELKSFDLAGGLANARGSGLIDLDRGSIVGGKIRAESPNIASLLALVDPELTGSGQLVIEGDLSKEPGAWDRAYRGDLRVNGQALMIEGKNVGTLAFRARIDDRVIEIPELSLNGELARILGNARVDADDLSADDLRGLAIDAPNLDIRVPDLAKLSRIFEALPPLAGSLTFQGSASKKGGEPWTALKADMKARGVDLVYETLKIDDLKVDFSAAEQRFDLSRIRAEGPWGELNSRGHALFADNGAGTGAIDELKAQLGGYPLALRQPASLRWNEKGHIGVENLALTALGGSIDGSLDWGDLVAANLDLKSLDLAGLPGEHGVQGKFAGKVTLGGSPEAPIIDLDFEIPDLVWVDPQVPERRLAGSIRSRILQRDQGLDINSFELLVPEHRIRALMSGTLPARLFDQGLEYLPWTASTLTFDVAVDAPTIAHQFGAPKDLTWKQVTLKGGLGTQGLQARVAVSQALWKTGSDNTDLPTDLQLDLTAEAAQSLGKLVVTGLEGLDIRGQVRLDQGLGERPDPEALAGLKTAKIDGNLIAKAPDLGAFRDLVPGLIRLGGTLNLDVAVAGTLEAPEPAGNLQVDNFLFRMDGDLPGLDKGKVRASFDRDLLTIAEAGGELGFAPIGLSGTVVLPKDDREAVFDLVVKGENALLARSRYLRVRSDLDLSVKGPLSGIKVAGEVNLRDALYTQPLSFVGTSARTADSQFQLFSFRDPPLSDLEFDIAILADRSIHLRNNLLNGEASTDLRLHGTGSVPRPDGRVTIDKLHVSLPFSKLDIERGTVFFDRGSPFSPRLDITGNTRMQGFDVNVQVSGRLPDQKVRILTEPYMPQEDALFLLTVGATRSGLQSEGLTRAALTRMGSLVSDSVLSNLFGPADPDEESFGDRFEMNMGRDVSDTGQPTIEMEYKVVEKIFMRAERDRYDDFNLGVIWRLKFR